MSEEKLTPPAPIDDKTPTTLNKKDFPSNSHKAKSATEAPKMTKVIEGNVKVKGESFWGKIRQSLTGDDAQSVGNYLLFDVVIPGTKNIISDLVTQGIERALYGDKRPVSSRRSNISGNSNYRAYNQAYNNPARQGMDVRRGPMPVARPQRENQRYNNIPFDSRRDAEAVMEACRERIEEFGAVTISNVLECCGITGNYVEDELGWFDLEGYGVVRDGGSYYLNLPAAESLK